MIITYFTDSSLLPDPLDCPGALDDLTCDRAEKIRRIRHRQTRKQSFGAGLLLEYAMRQQSAAPYQEGTMPPYQLNPYGKPISSQTSFNLSHTGNYVIVSIWANTPLAGNNNLTDSICIGCDIEQIKRYDPKIARRFFTETEYHCLESMDRQSQAEQFCRYWTRKECVMKLTGLGMALPMDLFDISRPSQAVPDRKKIAVWQSSKTGQQPECRRAADLLLNEKIFFREYSQDDCCITVCGTVDRFAQELFHVPALGLMK